jgi:hypothetical protein
VRRDDGALLMVIRSKATEEVVFKVTRTGLSDHNFRTIQNDSGLSQGLARSPCGTLEARRDDGAGNKWRYERIGGLPWLSRAT